MTKKLTKDQKIKKFQKLTGDEKFVISCLHAGGNKGKTSEEFARLLLCGDGDLSNQKKWVKQALEKDRRSPPRYTEILNAVLVAHLCGVVDDYRAGKMKLPAFMEDLKVAVEDLAAISR